MAKDKGADAGAKGTDQSAAAASAGPPGPRVRNAHTASLVLAVKGRKPVELPPLKPGNSTEIDPEIWAAAKAKPQVQGWLKAGLLVEEA